MFSTDKRRRPVSRGELSRALSTDNGGWPEPLRGAWPQMVALLATGCIVTWLVATAGEPFPYRVGQIVDREVRLRDNLQIENDARTRNKREEAVLNSPLAFRHDPAELRILLDKLNALAKAVAHPSEFAKIDPSVQKTWQLSSPMFESLRDLLSSVDAAAFEQKLSQVFRPMLEHGVLDENQLPRTKKRMTDQIEVHMVDPSESPRRLLVSLDDISLSKLSNVDGPLMERILKQFPDKAHAATLFQLLVSPASLEVPRLAGTLTYDANLTQANERLAHDSVAGEYDSFPKGNLVVQAGEAINAEQLRLLRKEHDKYQQSRSPMTSWRGQLQRYVGLAIIVLSLLGAIGWFLSAYQPELVQQPGRVMVLCGLAAMTIGMVRVASVEPFHAEVLPIAVAAMFMAIAYNRAVALIGAFALSLVAALLDPTPMPQFLVLLGGTSVAVLVLDNVRSRSKLIIVGFLAALAYGSLSAAVDCIRHQPWNLIVIDAVRRSAAGLIAGFFIGGCLPFIESVFRIVTDISLIELADSSHPILKELVRRAPGTYNHSVTVSIIGEAAAKAIGCNGLQVRVGALYHDIGKMLKPHYFVENMTENEKNRHEQLAPAMSTLIIIGHVKDGADLAEQYHLPQPIIDMIEQHHGTTLVDFFYREATRAMSETEDPEETVEESAFRYPGPKPQSKEAAALMLADCVESASRVLSEPTAASLEKLVHTLALNRLLDGQFDESGISLSELRLIEESLTKSMTSVYHGRIRYPQVV